MPVSWHWLNVKTRQKANNIKINSKYQSPISWLTFTLYDLEHTSCDNCLTFSSSFKFMFLVTCCKPCWSHFMLSHCNSSVPCWASMTAGSTWARSLRTLSCFSAITFVWASSACCISCDAIFFLSASCWSFTYTTITQSPTTVYHVGQISTCNCTKNLFYCGPNMN